MLSSRNNNPNQSQSLSTRLFKKNDQNFPSPYVSHGIKTSRQWVALRIAFILIITVCLSAAFSSPPIGAQQSAQSLTPLAYLPLVMSAQTTSTPTPTPGGATYSLRFYGTGSGDIDRLKIPMSTPLDVSLPVNIGAADFTLEFWLRFASGENNSGSCTEGNDTWIYGNIIFDRDIFGAPDYGDFGVSLYGGRIAFGVHNGTSGLTICGNTILSANTWHHIAVARRINGEMRIFVNGMLDRQASGPIGDISYRVGRSITNGWVNEPFLVIGAEKHDYDPNTYPSFSGWIDEVRISNLARYGSNFTPPNTPFTSDINTLGLYHLDEGVGIIVLDVSGASGGPSHGERRIGGPNNGPTYDSTIKRY